MLEDDHGVASLFAYAIAGLIFVGSLTAILLATKDMNDVPVAAGDPGNERLAQGIVEGLVRSQGVGWASPTEWDDAVGTRPGLATSPDSGVLLATHVLNLARAPKAALNDDLLNYDEAAALLGLNDAGGAGTPTDLNLGFHVRFEPVVKQPVTAGLPFGAATVLYVTDDSCALPPTEFQMIVAVTVPGAAACVDLGPVQCPANALTLETQLEVADPVLFVVGSDAPAAHACLNLAPSVTAALSGEWMLDGGDILVLGGDFTVPPTWHTTLLGSPMTPSQAPVHARPDPFHPLLRTPNVLQLPLHQPTAGDTEFPLGAAEAGFHNLVVDDQGTGLTTDDEVVLRTSYPAAFGNPGRFLVANLRPGILNDASPDLACGTGLAVAKLEGECFFQNILLSTYDELFLDYGPAVPDGIEARPGEALVLVQFPDLAAGVVAPTGLTDVPVWARVYVFPRP